jgi:hypothetical protein
VLLRVRPSTSHNGHIHQRVLTILIQKKGEKGSDPGRKS